MNTIFAERFKFNSLFYYILIFFGLTLLFGCRFGNKKTTKTSDVQVIDILKSYPKKEIILQNVAGIEYVPLETTDDILLSGVCQLAYLSDKYVVVWEPRLGDIFIFDRNGKIITHFNYRGQGNREYIITMNVIFDEKNEEIFVFDNPQTRKILVYSLTGEYKRTLKYSEDYLNIIAYNFDDDALLVYDETNLFLPEYNKKPYLFMSKKDGSFVSSLDIFLPVRYHNRTMTQFELNGQTAYMPFTINAPNNRYYGQSFLIADISSDTIYRLTKNKELTPLIIRKPSVHSSEPRKVLTHQFSTDKFMFVNIITLDFEAAENGRSITNKDLIYEFDTGETSEVSFVNGDYPSSAWWFPQLGYVETSPNTVALLEQTPRLKKALEKNQLKGELEKLVEMLDEDDNPVLMIVKF